MMKTIGPRFPSACLALLVCAAIPAPAQPRIPVDDDEVLLRVDRPHSMDLFLSAHDEAIVVESAATNRTDSVSVARQLIRRARLEGNPRALLVARRLVEPWCGSAAPDANALLLRATIKQSLHDFRGALEDLEKVLQLDPANGQAWLTCAVVQTVTGRYEAARLACLQSTRFSDQLAALTATASLSGATGNADEAYSVLRAALERDRTGREAGLTIRSQIRAWALVTLGELAERRGLPDLARQHYAAALELVPGDPVALAMWADVMMEEQRHGEVTDALHAFRHMDALQLRLAEAHRHLGVSDWEHREIADRLTENLARQFAAARSRGSMIHLREEARFCLNLADDPERAFELARENWREQREWTDLKLLEAAARSCGRTTILELESSANPGKPQPNARSHDPDESPES